MSISHYFLLASIALLSACGNKDAQQPNQTNAFSQVFSSLTSKEKTQEIVKNITGTTWRGIEGKDHPKQITFLENGIARFTWMDFEENKLNIEDGGTWKQNGNEVYFEYRNKISQSFGTLSNGVLKGTVESKPYDTVEREEFELKEIDPKSAEPYERYARVINELKKKRLESEEKERQAQMAVDCSKITGWRTDAPELVARALNVSVTSVWLLRTEVGSTGRCLAVVDTPRGPTRCVVKRIFQDKDTKSYGADLGDVFSVQAVCGGLAF